MRAKTAPTVSVMMVTQPARVSVIRNMLVIMVLSGVVLNVYGVGMDDYKQAPEQADEPAEQEAPVFEAPVPKPKTKAKAKPAKAKGETSTSNQRMAAIYHHLDIDAFLELHPSDADADLIRQQRGCRVNHSAPLDAG
jgi:hypothetical protein